MKGAMTKRRSEAVQLTAEDKEYAATYLNETDDNRAHAIAEIRRWITESDDLRSRTDDFFILRFLRTSKFNIELTKKRIRNYLQQRADIPEWYANRDPLLPEVQAMLDLGVFLPLRKLDDQGRMIVIGRPHLRVPYKQKLSDLLKASILIMDTAEEHQVPGSLRGVVVIADIEGVSLGHLVELRPSVLRNMVDAWHGSYPLRIKSIMFVNMPTYVNVIVSIFRKFMNAKLKQRFHVFMRDAEDSWAEGLPADLLPVEYGGTGCSLDELKEYWKKMVEENRDWLMDDEKYKVVSDADDTS